MNQPDRITAHVAVIVATADIAAALRELKYLHDPKMADVVANVRQRLEAARAEIDTAALFIEGRAVVDNTRSMRVTGAGGVL